MFDLQLGYTEYSDDTVFDDYAAPYKNAPEPHAGGFSRTGATTKYRLLRSLAQIA